MAPNCVDVKDDESLEDAQRRALLTMTMQYETDDYLPYEIGPNSTPADCSVDPGREENDATQG